MQEMHPNIMYLGGKKNIVADFLSRYEYSMKPKEMSSTTATKILSLSYVPVTAPPPVLVGGVDCSPFRISYLQGLDRDIVPWVEFLKERFTQMDINIAEKESWWVPPEGGLNRYCLHRGPVNDDGTYDS
jgi:hypothetical protein